MRHDQRESDEPVFEPRDPRPKAARRKRVKTQRRRAHGHVQHDDHKITGPCFVYLRIPRDGGQHSKLMADTCGVF